MKNVVASLFLPDILDRHTAAFIVFKNEKLKNGVGKGFAF